MTSPLQESEVGRAQCVGVLGRVFGHRYTARFSRAESQRSLAGFAEASGGAARMLLQPLVTETYHGDVCTRCGHVVNRGVSSSTTAQEEPK